MNLYNLTELDRGFVLSNAPSNSALLDCYTLDVPNAVAMPLLAVYQAGVPGAIDEVQIVTRDDEGFVRALSCTSGRVSAIVKEYQQRMLSTLSCKTKWIKVFHGFIHMTGCLYSYVDLPAEARRVALCFSLENEEPIMCYKALSTDESINAYVVIYKSVSAGVISYRGSVICHDYERKSIVLDEESTPQELLQTCKELINKQFYYGCTWKKLYAK